MSQNRSLPDGAPPMPPADCEGRQAYQLPSIRMIQVALIALGAAAVARTDTIAIVAGVVSFTALVTGAIFALLNQSGNRLQ